MEDTLARFAIAFLIGALIGIEREKTQREDGDTTATGLRTFILISLCGAIAAWLSVTTDGAWIFAAGTLATAALILSGYRAELQATPHAVGLTTEFAAFVTYLLGGLTLYGSPQVAVGIAIAVSAVLAYRRLLHGAVERIGWRELFAALKLLIVAFIVLPVVPREPVDPWGVLNPYAMTWLVLLIAGLSFLGYLVARWLGPERGVAVTGLAGGLVSSTAVTLSLSRQSREAGGAAAATLATGILLSWAVMFARVIVLCIVVNRALALAVAAPMGVMAAITLLGAAYHHRRGERLDRGAGVSPLQNPLSIAFAVRFALVFAAVALLVDRADALLDPRAIHAVAALAGLTDVDAITLSVARRDLDASTATIAITIAALSNTLLKTAMAAWIGRRPLGSRILPVAIAILAGAVAALVFFAR